MSIGSLSSGTVSTATLASADASANAAKARETEAAPTIADHVALADEQEPIRSVSSTLGTLVDTYL
ncbi:hypothetical protein [Actinoplanes friuliensis]|jgi:hypothetical protein|uniref:Uncharacterized protein n=1 Tax=Actinoplanes friuliensis DSM 7358 TaxID=1246995 RepID=U5W2S2_9ACTN|nr:hypothetical protein [Actinoplanes friuliensis]AGZ43528.1 hypothetical protein AFR_26330 [Actinoplanes friuliensis DSM 7358]